MEDKREDETITIDDEDDGGIANNSQENVVEDNMIKCEPEEEVVVNGGNEKEDIHFVKKIKKKVPSDQEWFSNLPDKEIKYLKKHMLTEDELSAKTIVCTACFRQVNHREEGSVVRHPALGVPVCKQCKRFYKCGEWTQGEDGYFEHCRWCANGGDLLCCDACSNAFCKRCIKRNLGRAKVTEIEEIEEWKCLQCEPRQIWRQRTMYYSVWQYQLREARKEQEMSVSFIDNTIKDGFDVNKILGNYLDRSKRSWAKKNDKLDQGEVVKTVVKLRTIIKICHHNLFLLDKNLLSGCLGSYPQLDAGQLEPVGIPSDGETAQDGKKEENTPKEEVGNTESVEEPSQEGESIEVSADVNGDVDTEHNYVEHEEEQKAIEHADLNDINTSVVVSTEDGCEIAHEPIEQESEEIQDESALDGSKDMFSVSDEDLTVTNEELTVNNENEKNRNTEVEVTIEADDSINKDTIDDNDQIDQQDSIPKSAVFGDEVRVSQTGDEVGEQLMNPEVDENIHDINPDASKNDDDIDNDKNSEEIDLEKANAAAKAAVLQSTSSESDGAKVGNEEESELSPRKKLRTKKELDSMRRKSGGGDGDDAVAASSDEENDRDQLLSPKGSRKKRKLSASNPVAESDSDLEKKVRNGRSRNSKNSSDSSSSSSSVQEVVRKKDREKKRRRIIKHLNKVAAQIDVKNNKLLNKNTKVDIGRLTPMIKEDLEKYGEVDVTEYPKLNLVKSSSGDLGARDIDRLCDLTSLKKVRRPSGTSSDGSSVTRNSNNRQKGKVESKAPGLGDISSGESGGDNQTDGEDSEHENKLDLQSRNDLAKAAVLASSSDDDDDSSSDNQEVKPLEVKEKVKRPPKAKVLDSDEESSGQKKRTNRPALLSMKLSESETTGTSEDERKYRNKMEKRVEKHDIEGPSGADTSPDSDIAAQSSAKKKKIGGKRRKIMSSDSQETDNYEEDESSEPESDSSVEESKKKKRRRKKSDTSSNSDSEEKPKRRKRIKNASDNSDDDEKESPTKGRHNIKKIIKDKHLEESTKGAAAEERERRKRIEERQQLYNQAFKINSDDGEDAKDKVTEQLVLDFDPDTKEILVEVDRKLVKKLKPHQVKGVKFMWDSVFESLSQLTKEKCPGGSILAHCMGLGKTLQTITLTHTVLDNRKVTVDRAMVICPVNTVKNWQDEFDKWLKGDLEIDVYEMSGEKDNWARADKMEQWFREGGVLIIGYDMFRNLTNEKNTKFKTKQRNTFNKCLLDPGPDLVICDEGHLLKNEKSAINKAVNRITTPRRIILTGTPLQNNLKEYYEMVNFVKPSLMGTRKEFMNRFVNPIVNGQHSDSTERDIRMMKKRSFILNDLLKGCMQRLDYNVLVPYLQPKQEYVVAINMSDIQKTLYKFYLENYAKAGQIGSDGKLEGGKKGGLFYDVQILSRIWNHPCILLLAKQRQEEKEDVEDDEEESLKDFIDDGSGDDDDSDIQELDNDGIALKKTVTRADKADDLVDGLEDAGISGSNGKGWWNQFLSDEDSLNDLKFGSKVVLLMDILKECALIGDKVLVFSQSILSLDLIEDFLARVNTANGSGGSGLDPGMQDYLDTWQPGKDYYRMDGSTAADTRKVWCKYFNRSTSHRMRLFLISTKAGGLGINLVAANRVIIFDASWNPSHDVQSIFRVFRFGQTKPVYVYRFLAKGTMEEKIYDRQVTKQSLSARVVDEQQIERHFTMNELSELYEFTDEPQSARPVPLVPDDRLLAELVDKHKNLIWSIHHHDSLLENKVDENLTEEERKNAWEEFEQEKKGMVQTNVGIENTQQFGMMIQGMLPKSGDGRIMASPINPMAIQKQLKSMNPELTHEELVQRTRSAIMQLQNMHRTQTPVIVNQNTLNVAQQRQTTGYDQSYYQAEMAKAKAMINNQYPGMYSRFRGPNPHGPSGMPVQMMRHPPTMKSGGPSEVITLDGGPEVGSAPMPRMPMRGIRPRGGRGGRRGRPRLDPDTDLDFSPEPQSASSSELLARLQQAGMTVSPASSSGEKKSGNES